MIDSNIAYNFVETIAPFIAASGTRALVLVDVSPGLVMPLIVGESPLPGEASVRQRVLIGGSRTFDLTISSTDSAANAAQFYDGLQATVAANTGATAAWINTSNTINRASGSFVTDGWQIGDTGMIFGAVNASNNGTPFQVTSVSATTLTANGTPFTTESTTWPTGSRLFRISRRSAVAVPANAGNATTITPSIPNVQVIANSNDSVIDKNGISIGSTSALIVAMFQAVSALPATISIKAQTQLY